MSLSSSSLSPQSSPYDFFSSFCYRLCTTLAAQPGLLSSFTSHPPSYFSAPTWQVASKSETTDTTRTWWKEQEEGKQQIIFESRCFHDLTSHILVVMALQHFTPIFRKHDKLSRHSKKNWTNTWFDESSRSVPSPTTTCSRPRGEEGQDPSPEWNPAENHSLQNKDRQSGATMRVFCILYFCNVLSFPAC